MNRPIKFRAWDKFEKRMRSWEEVTASTAAEALIPEILLNSVRYEALEFTGLTDIKGKEIYEGDVLERYGVQEPIQVYWKAPSFVTKGAARPGSWYFDTADEVEILGNIYENPELLSV